MDLTDLKGALLWCTLFNYLFLLLWAGLFILARDWMYRLHGRWFRLTPQTFDALHYAGLAFYKVTILFFNLVPWLALSLIG
jgi:hypothetical protein